jgi:CRISPR type III-B/RAMP module RAMP protein Cmr6
MPCIPGHGVKGALRAVFPHHKNEQYRDAKIKMLSCYLTDILRKSNPSTTMEECFSIYVRKLPFPACIAHYSESGFIDILENIIFEGREPCGFNCKTNEVLYKKIPIYERDIFHDAYIRKVGKEGHFLGDDYITPHPDPLKAPNPIKFLKILSGTQLAFQFDLKDKLITAEQKYDLFVQILLDFGVGAKTNVGYGQLQG